MKLKLFQVDAFAEQVFEGNPAAVCPLNEWLDDTQLQAIADENNLSETAFIVAKSDHFELRWFTPEAEVDLCGHATLASAHVVFNHLGYRGAEVRFQTRSGILTVAKQEDRLVMDFPATQPEEVTPPAALLAGLNIAPKKVYAGFDYIAVYDSEADIRALTPDFAKLSELDLRGVLVTAPGMREDFVSRCFFPKLRVNEDPVTGSAHCQLAPLWLALGRKSATAMRLTARQLSKRGGTLTCEVIGDRVQLIGAAQDYLQGEITLP